MAALVAVPLSASAEDTQPTPAARLTPWTGGPLPKFTLDDLSAMPRDLTAFGDRIVLLHFFATWCEPCVRELTSLQRLRRAVPEGRLAIVAVDVAEVDLRVRAFFQKLPVDFPVLLDRDRAITKAWQVSALPSTFMLDATLAPRLFVEGDLDWTGSETIAALQRLDPAITLHPAAITAATTKR